MFQKKILGVNIHNLEIGNGYLCMTSKTQVKKKKRKKIGFIKVKIPCTKGHYKQSERQPTEWENIFMKHIYDNKLVSRIQKTIMIQQQKEKQPNF